MSTEPVSGYSPLPQQDVKKRTAGTEGSEGASRLRDDGRETRTSETPASRPEGEKLQISREARELLELNDLMSAAKKSLDEEPEVRAQRVAEVRERLKAGVYDTKGIRDELAHRLTSILRGLPISED